MSHEIQIGTDLEDHFGQKKQFVIFAGDTFLEKIKGYFDSQSDEIKECNEATVEGYLSGMVREVGTRLLRDYPCRKKQVGKQPYSTADQKHIH